MELPKFYQIIRQTLDLLMYYMYIRGRQTCPKSVQYKRYGLQTEPGSGVPQVPMAVDQGDRGPPGREIKI